MKKFVLFISILFLALPIIGKADSITLNSDETLQVPTSKKMDWYVDHIDADAELMRIRYRWRGDAGEVIVLENRRDAWQVWECRNIEVPGTNAECTDAGVPYECCTGVGTGTCDDMIDTCFSDVFGYVVDSGNPMLPIAIGIGLRTLIWNQMKQDILTGGNDGTFD